MRNQLDTLPPKQISIKGRGCHYCFPVELGRDGLTWVLKLAGLLSHLMLLKGTLDPTQTQRRQLSDILSIEATDTDQKL